MERENITGGYIFDIQGFSVHDGPGCRTLIFLKGCTLECRWCSNPEGIEYHPSLIYKTDKCIRDGLCIDSCKVNAITINNGSVTFNRASCRNCNDRFCIDACLTGALQIAGYFITLDDLFEIIKRDRKYWGKNGGITLSGGEPLFQIEFSREILKKCYDAYIHTAIETCGNIPWNYFESVMALTDLIIFDLKTLDNDKHIEFTKDSNQLILENCKNLSRNYKGQLCLRMPLIPGFNDSYAHIKLLADFLSSINKKEIHLLPLHHLGKEKYNLLNRDYKFADFRIPSPKEILNTKSIFESFGIVCSIN